MELKAAFDPVVCCAGHRLFLYGAGGTGQTIHSILLARGLRVTAFIDRDHPPGLDAPCLTLEEYLRQREEGDTIAITSRFALDIAVGLLCAGVYDFVDWRILVECQDNGNIDHLEMAARNDSLAISAWARLAMPLGGSSLETRWLFKYPTQVKVQILIQAGQLLLSECGAAVEALGMAKEAFDLAPDEYQVADFLAQCLYLCGRRRDYLELFRPLDASITKAPQGRVNVYLPETLGTAFGHMYLLQFSIMKKLMFPELCDSLVLPIRRQACSNPFLLELFSKYIDIQIMNSEEEFENSMQDETIANNRDFFKWRFGQGELVTLQAVLMRWETCGNGSLLGPPDVSNRLPENYKTVLEEAGINSDRWFVTLHVRQTDETGYNRTRMLRNADIHRFIPLIADIHAMGGQVVRIGDPGMDPLPPLEGLVDLTRETARPEWIDVYLLSHCRAFVGVNSGPGAVAQMFGVPCLFTNSVPLSEPALLRRTLYIPKLYRSVATGEILSVRQMLEEPFVMTESPDVLKHHGVVASENSETDILAAGRQLLEEAEHGITDDENDQQRQQQLMAAYRDMGIPRSGRMGKVFLQNYESELLAVS